MLATPGATPRLLTDEPHSVPFQYADVVLPLVLTISKVGEQLRMSCMLVDDVQHQLLVCDRQHTSGRTGAHFNRRDPSLAKCHYDQVDKQIPADTVAIF